MRRKLYMIDSKLGFSCCSSIFQTHGFCNRVLIGWTQSASFWMIFFMAVAFSNTDKRWSDHVSGELNLLWTEHINCFELNIYSFYISILSTEHIHCFQLNISILYINCYELNISIVLNLIYPLFWAGVFAASTEQWLIAKALLPAASY